MTTTTEELKAISNRLKSQDNRCTSNPMFCVQIKVRDVGYDSAYTAQTCWRDSANDETIYDDDKDFKGEPSGIEWGEFGYEDRWETVMVCFTYQGCEDYLLVNGHNERARAHNGEVRIYVESFNRCDEMTSIRHHLIGLTSTPKIAVSDNAVLGFLLTVAVAMVALVISLWVTPSDNNLKRILLTACGVWTIYRSIWLCVMLVKTK